MRKHSVMKSPLRDRPLRLPGESLQEDLETLIENRVLFPIIFAVISIALAVDQWFFYLHPARGIPWLATLFSLGVVAFAAVCIARTMPRVRAMRLGRDGERIVAEQLDVLKGQGAAIFHDVLADGFNIDHIIISSKGVFAVETKTWSKPARGSPTVTYEGEVLRINGMRPDRDPVSQARMNAAWVSAELKRSTGKHFPTKPVVLFPGWFVEPVSRGADVWILEPKALPAFISNEPTKLHDTDVHLATYHMARLVRSTSNAA
jgi:hypothetical protein